MKKMTQKVLSIMMAVSMLFGSLPVAAFSEEIPDDAILTAQETAELSAAEDASLEEETGMPAEQDADVPAEQETDTPEEQEAAPAANADRKQSGTVVSGSPAIFGISIIGPAKEKKDSTEENPEEVQAAEESPLVLESEEDADFSVSVSCAPDSGIPADARLSVTVVEEKTDASAPQKVPMKVPAQANVQKTNEVSDKTSDGASDETPDALLDYPDDSARLVTEADLEFYRRSLDISILDSEGNEIEPNPDAVVTVTVTLDDADPDSPLDVYHIVDGTPVPVENLQQKGTEVTFTVSSFSEFRFVNRAQKLFTETTEYLLNTIFGRTKDTQADYKPLSAETMNENILPGLTVLDAFQVTSLADLWVSLQRIREVSLENLESLKLYSVVDGEILGLVKDNVTMGDVLSLSMQGIDGLALVLDSGLRSRELEAAAAPVRVSGLVPKEASLSVTEIDPETAAERLTLTEKQVVLADYDISILNAGSEWQPAANNQAVEVSVDCAAAAEALATGYGVEIWHLLPEGGTEKVEITRTEDETLFFPASGFSEYVVVRTVIEKTISTPDGKNYKVTVTYDTDSHLPEDVDLDVAEVDAADYQEAAAATVESEENLTALKAFDISIVTRDEVGNITSHHQPDGKVDVSIELLGRGELADPRVLHMGADGSVEDVIVPEMTAAEDGVSLFFQADSFSVYVVAETILTEVIEASDGNTYEIEVIYKNTSGIPMDGTALLVSELKLGDAGYEDYMAALAQKVGTKEENIKFSRAFDIQIVDENNHDTVYEPTGDVTVSIRLVGEDLEDYANLDVFHFVRNENEEEFTVCGVSSTVNKETVQFITDSFSVYIVAGYVLETTLEIEGKTYKVTATYDDNAELPGDAELKVSEILSNREEFLTYLNDTAAALGVSAGELGYLRMFDIAIVGEDDTEYTPNDHVKITVELLDSREAESGAGFDDLHVVHFGEKTEELEAETEGDTVTFITESFSMFSFVDLSLVQNIVDAVFGSTYAEKVYENDDIIVSGKMPRTAVVEVNPAPATIEGETVLVSYDIKIYSSEITRAFGLSWQPGEDAVQVQIRSDALNAQYADIYHIEENTTPELISNTVEIDDHTVVFDANHFSVYAVGTAPRKTFYFYNDKDLSDPYFFKLDDSSVTTNRQIIKNGESLVMPQLPQRGDLTFIGWFNCGTDEQQEFEISIPVTADETINLYARFGNIANVTFYAAKDSGTWPINYIRSVELQEGTGTVRIDDIQAIPVNDKQVFLGWTRSQQDAEDPTNTEYITDTEITVTGDIYLYPVFAEAHWFRFSSGETGNGASYKSPQYQLTNSTDNHLDVITRTGYTFKGWYADADASLNGTGTQVTDENGNIQPNLNIAGASSDSSGNMTLSEDITLYARWEANANTKYTVVYWLQRVSDAPGLANNAKTYDYIIADTSRNAQTGSTVTLRNTDKNPSRVGGTGTEYVFNSANSTPTEGLTVQADGSTVLNAYFDLAEVTLTFQVEQNNRWVTVSTVTGLYGQSITHIFEENPLKMYRDQGYIWTDYYKEVYKEILSTIEMMPAKNVTFRGSVRGNTSTAYYYLESLDQTSGLSDTRRAFTIDGQQLFFDLYKSIKHNFNFLTYNEEYHPIGGFRTNRAYAEPYFGEPGRSASNNNMITNQDRAPIGGRTTNRTTEANVNYLYYVRESYMLSLINYNNELIRQSLYKFQQPINDPGTPANSFVPMQNAGYYFTGWYADQGLSTRVFFSEEEAAEKKEETKDENGNYNYVVISEMPSHVLNLFAGWQQEKYPVTINPDGGVLSDTESTYFNASYGERITEYSDISRHYVEREEGDTHPDSEIYYYHYDTKALNNTTGNTTRKAYYYPKSEGIKPQTRLDDNGQPVEYIYNPGTYSLVGWYRVVGGKLVLYDFSSKVTEQTTLQAVWRKSGIWYVKYDAQNAYLGRGTGVIMSEGVPNYTVQLNTEYADGSVVVLEKAAEPEEGSEWQFVGWHIKGDDTDTIYYPNEGFVYRSAFADSNHVLTLEAVYEKIEKTSITYDANGGTGTLVNGGTLILDDMTQTLSVVNNKVDNLENNSEVIFSTGEGFVRSGYRQIGWSLYAGRNDSDFDPMENPTTDFHNDGITSYIVDDPNGNILYAVWERTYSITYRPNGGSGALAGLTANGDGSYSDRGIIRGTEATITDEEFVRSGYRFIGWNSAADGSGTSYAAGDEISSISEDVTLYAQWEKLLHITYDANGGTGTLTNPSYLTANGNGQFFTGDIYIQNSSVDLSNGETLTRSGYMLTGWNTTANGSGMHYDCSESITITEDMVLYAEWTPLHNLIYNANGGSGTLINGGSYVFDETNVMLQNANAYANIPQGSVITLSDGNGFSRTGYTQIGWNTDRAGANSGTVEYGLSDSTMTLNMDTTLYAVWAENKALTYHINGGSGAPAASDEYELLPIGSGAFSTGKVYPIGTETIAATVGTMNREGYVLLGWSTVSSRTPEEFSADNGTDFAPGGSVTVNTDTDLYAVWQKKLHIIYDLNGGSGMLTDPEGLIRIADGQFSTGDIYASGSDVTLSDGTGSSYTGFILTGWNTFADGNGTLYEARGTLEDIIQDTTLYAQWGGTLYLKLVNQTDGALSNISVSLPSGMTVSANSNPTLSLAAGTEQTLTINIDQELMSKIITGTAADAEKQFTVSGTNNLGASYMLVVESQLGDAGVTGRSVAANGNNYAVTDTLSTAETMTVTFTAERQRVLQFVTKGGPVIEDVVFDVGDTSYTMPVLVWAEHSFTGWAEADNGPAVVAGGTPVELDDLFPNGVYERTAYAVWADSIPGNGEVYVYKNVTGDGDTSKEFLFTIDLDAEYSFRADGCNGGQPVFYRPKGQETITLKHGEYFKITIQNTDGENRNSTEKLSVELQKYNANGTPNGKPITVFNTPSEQKANYSLVSSKLTVTENNDGYTTTCSISGAAYIGGTGRFGETGSQNGENASTSFEISGEGETSGIIGAKGSVVYNNNYTIPKSNIIIEKAIRTQANDPLKNSEDFTFEVRKDNPNGALYKQFTIANLNGNNSYILTDIPVGTVLYVSEVGTTAEDFNTEVAVTSGSILDGTTSNGNKTYTFTVGSDDAIITFTNTRKTANITINKTVENDLLTEEEKNALSFTIQATLTTAGGVPVVGYPVQDGSGTTISSTDTNGRISFNISRLSGKVLKLPVGGKLLLDEMSMGSYELNATATGLEGDLVSGFIVDDDGGSVSLTNTLKTATVTVLKDMEDGLDSDNSVFFGFTANLYDSSGNLLSYGEFTGGTRSFSLASDNSQTLIVPLGAKLTVTENTTDTDKYTVSASGSLGIFTSNTNTYEIASVPGAGDIITFTNTRNKVQVVVSKLLNNPVATSTEEFTYTAELRDNGNAVGNYYLSSFPRIITDDSGEATFTMELGNGETQSLILTIPYGTTLSIQENENSKYTTTGTAVNGSYTENDQTAVFTEMTSGGSVTYTNVLKNQDMFIKKITEDPLNPDKIFSFDAVVKNEAGIPISGINTGTAGTTGTDGRVSFMLSNAGIQTLTLPVGATMEITEFGADLYTTIAEPETTGKISGTLNGKTYIFIVPEEGTESERKVVFTNTKTYVPVTVTKTLNDPVNGDNSIDFSFELQVYADPQAEMPINLPDTWTVEGNTTALISGGNTGKFSISSTHGNSANQVLYLPIGSYVNITENEDSRYQTTVTENGLETMGNTASISQVSANSYSFTFTNTRKTVPITVMKVNEMGNALNGAGFELSGTPANGSVSTNGSSTVFVGELYYGSEITLTETSYPVNYGKETSTVATIRADDTGLITASNATVSDPDTDGHYTVSIQNFRNIHTITVSKKLDDLFASGDVSFSFQAVLTDENDLPIADYAINGTNRTNADGTYPFTLQVTNGSTVDINLDIPQGTNLTVQENLDTAQAAEYTTTVDGETTTEKRFTNVQADIATLFENTRKTSRVYVVKQLSDLFATEAQNFTFEALLEMPDGTPVELYDLSIGQLSAAANGNTTDADGKHRFTLSAQNTETTEHYLVVPAGARLKVTEVLTEEQTEIYSTTVKYNSENAENAAEKQIDAVLPEVNSTLLFTNTRKTVTVLLTKQLSGTSVGNFPFTAEVYNEGAIMEGYNQNNFTAGLRSFTLEKDASIELIVPIGAMLVLTEDVPDSYYVDSIKTLPIVADTGTAMEVLSFTANQDTEIIWTNQALVAPTGMNSSDLMPFVIALSFGIVLMLFRMIGRKRRMKNIL